MSRWISRLRLPHSCVLKQAPHLPLDYHLGELGIDTAKQHETTTKRLCCLLDVVLAIPFPITRILLNKWFNHALRERISINSNNWESEQRMMVENLMPPGASTAAAATGRGLAGTGREAIKLRQSIAKIDEIHGFIHECVR